MTIRKFIIAAATMLVSMSALAQVESAGAVRRRA